MSTLAIRAVSVASVMLVAVGCQRPRRMDETPPARSEAQGEAQSGDPGGEAGFDLAQDCSGEVAAQGVAGGEDAMLQNDSKAELAAEIHTIREEFETQMEARYDELRQEYSYFVREEMQGDARIGPDLQRALAQARKSMSDMKGAEGRRWVLTRKKAARALGELQDDIDRERQRMMRDSGRANGSAGQNPNAG